MENKICSKCNDLKPLDNFNKDNRLKTYPDGRRNICKSCKIYKNQDSILT